MPLVLSELKSEILNNPRTYRVQDGRTLQQAANDGSHIDIADALNRVRDGSAGTVPDNPTGDSGQANGIIPVNRLTITRAELLEAMDIRDWFGAAVSPVTQQHLFQAAHMEGVMRQDNIALTNADGSDTRTRANLDRAIINTNGSQTRFNALKTKPGSRGQEKWGNKTDAPFTVTMTDVQVALALP